MDEFERISFPGALGTSLSARLHRPAGTTRAYALFAHCFTCSKDLRAVVGISRALADKGIATLRFDFTGLGESEGDFADTHFSSNVADLLAAAAYLRANHTAPSLLIGHSLGGAAVLAAAAQLDDVKAVATIGAPAEPKHVEHVLEAGRPELEEKGEAEVSIGGRRFRIKQQLLEDLARHCNKDAIASLDAALMVFHSPQDAIVGIENARDIYEAARHPKSFVTLDGADHLLSRLADANYVGAVLAAWADRYLPSAVDVSTATAHADDGMACGCGPEESPPHDGTVYVESIDLGLRQKVTAGPHQWIADEPASLGGNDEGPTPYDMLLAGLGVCTSMTLRMYAKRKGWPLDKVRIVLTHQRVHAKDCADCESESGYVDEIERTLEIQGELDEAQRTRLTEIADKCPVHKTLTTETIIRTQVTRPS